MSTTARAVNSPERVSAGRGGRLARSALWHAARGLVVFPLRPGSKRPAVDDWPHAATTDPGQIAQWWSDAPYNIGVATGPSNLLVIDLDRPRHLGESPPEPWNTRGVTCGRDVLEHLASIAGQRLPRTWTVTTGSGGQHLYFRQPGEIVLGNTAGKLGWKIDTRGNGGYVVAAGSVTRGQRYRADLIRRPQILPAWIIAGLTAHALPAPCPGPSSGVRVLGPAYGLKALEGQLDKLLTSTPGYRNDQLNASAYALGRVAASGALDAQMVSDELLSAALRVGLGRREAERTIESGLTAGLSNPRRIVS
ncbi:bifunctional DNA primase/polymerase [Kribbella jiaozuonensis]|uniref:Bifunctional DNA primase/polymerase n=1 Tax=Kribbella jiaozuonensis TaxID=2575441 RepID=A0A4U3LTN8_9ACTN|nr:bifunctional DNA primase/polymerase [Kribbella jiaozuonensis]TKK79170.1 bifunctional DNA primase/polymerase [Kribbella jiaozuonensis]TKK83240.1 bifunctional DNA primase/polymerase [Kribbella jiaozuonensis]